MNTKTILFRIALSLSVVWLGVATVLTWNKLQFESSPSEISMPDLCADEVPIIAANGSFTSRAPTYKEIADCNASRLKLQKDFDDRRSWEALVTTMWFFLSWAVVPIAVALGLAAFKAPIRNGIVASVQRYIRWLKGNA